MEPKDSMEVEKEVGKARLRTVQGANCGEARTTASGALDNLLRK